MELSYNILNGKRFSLLAGLKYFKNDFYLAGGTGLALQLGHRISEDFDFFTDKPFDNGKLIKELKNAFQNQGLSVLQDEPDTLTVLIDEVKISFFKLDFKNILSLMDSEYFNLAQILEIALMKLVALPRAAYRDYVDIYFILKNYELREIFKLLKQKHPEYNEGIYLKCLLSYDDVDISPIVFTKGFEVDESEVFKFIEEKTLKFIKST